MLNWKFIVEKFAGPTRTRLEIDAKLLAKPLSIVNACKIEVSVRPDFFFPDLPDWIRRLGFAVMSCCPQHSFEITTRHGDNAVRFFTREENSFNEVWCEAMWYERNYHPAGNPFPVADRLRVLESINQLPKRWPLANVTITNL
jgi:hypothetical protein